MESKFNTFEKGLYRDSTAINQPDGTYPYALNAVNESSGEITAIINEEGNFPCLGIPSSSILGSILLDDSIFVLFIKDNNSIILFDSKTCTKTDLIQSDCLNFQSQIQGVTRVIKGCERVIYFVDGINPDRAINIDNILDNPTSHEYLDLSGNVDCDLIRDRKDFEIPTYTNIMVNPNGGSLKLGSYQIILQYEDEDGFQTGFFGHTLEIPITNDFGGYDEITGGDPLYFPLTPKSITMELGDIDLNYKYIKIFLAETVNHITLYYEIDKLVINNTFISYTITSTSGKTQVDGGQFNVDYSFYETSDTIAQIDDRLLKGNVKEKQIDYSKFQIAANDIKVNYIVKDADATDPNDDSGSVKTSQYYTDNKSYMRDEIYSLGIVWVFKNGLRTPAMHIPGRAKDTPARWTFFDNLHTRPISSDPATMWDSELLPAGTITTKLSDFKHLQNQEFDYSASPNLQCERWKAYNTAVRSYYNGPNGVYYSKGELAYWESSYDYPNALACDGVTRIYPEGKIRHHKMPDTTLEQHFDSSANKILPLGLEITNINPPAEYIDDIQGYYIVREKRNSINKTVLDKGIIYNNTIIDGRNKDIIVPRKEYNKQTDWFGLSRFRNLAHNSTSDPWWGLIPQFSLLDTDAGSTEMWKLNGSSDVRDYEVYDDKSFSFHGVVNKFYKQSGNATHYKQELLLNGDAKIENITKAECDDDNDIKLMTYSGSYPTADVTIPAGNFTNVSITSPLVYMVPDKNLPESLLRRHFLNDNQQEALIFETDDAIANPQADFDIGENKFPLPITAYYGSIKNHKVDIYGQLNNNQYQSVDSNIVPVSTSSVTVFGGDCFINQFSFFKSAYTKTPVNKNCNFKDSWGTDKNNDNSYSRRFCIQKQLITYFVESEINSELRHIDYNNLSDIRNTFYPYTPLTPKQFLELDWVDKQNDDAWEEGTYMKNLYLYNTDYHKENEVKSYFALDNTFDFCSDCIVDHKTRIAYSEKGGESDSIDNYRVFLANNFRDLPSNTGEITNLFVNFNELYAHTRYTIYKVFTKPHELRSDQATLYVGVGGFFSVPSRELVSTEYGYGGSSGKLSTKTTEFGTIFVDDLTGKIFLFTDSLIEISSKAGENNTGMRNWFEENIPLSLNQQWLDLTGENYPYLNQPALPYGIGFITYYDPRHKRIIITKKDYYLNNVQPPMLADPTTINFNDIKHENRSWTISFSLLNFSWVSYHSYIPDFAFNNANDFFTTIHEQNSIWKHGERNYQTYYGVKNDFIVEYIQKDNPVISKVFDKISYIGKCEVYDTTHKQFRDINNKTFTHLLAYNSYQTTGKLKIDLKDDPFEMIASANGILAYEKENVWNINDFRDYCINRNVPLNSSRWVNIRNEYPIDKVPNPAAYSPNKSVFDLEVMRDLYLTTRLYFNDVSDIRFTLSGVITDEKVSLR